MIEILADGVTHAAVIAAEGGYERHPESFPLRVFVYVMAEKRFYELLQTGEAIPWGDFDTPPPDTLDYWIVDAPTIHSVGVHLAK